MNRFLSSFAVLLLFFFAPSGSFAQTPNYNPYKAFDPLFSFQPVTSYRSADGQPGPEYWINETDYKIHARLDTVQKSVTADEIITYTNKSPNKLSYLWVLLPQNRFAKDSRSTATSGQTFNDKKFNGGFTIQSVEIESDGKYIPSDYLINDTRMQIRLTKAMAAKNGVVKIRINYSFTVVPQGNGRSGWMNTKNGTIFEVAQWFPRMAVYDDIVGWNVLPFLGAGEFYLDYGNFDVTLDVPGDQIVAASGKLVNPDKVLNKETQERLQKASESSKTVMIRSLNEVIKGEGTKKEKRLIWHFTMKNSRDFTWASSKAFIWDGARADLPDHKSTLAMAFYPEESMGKNAWNRATEFLQHSIELFSKKWFVYPYPTASTVGGPVGGMEYPGIVFCHWKSTGNNLWMVINHEIGHDWFPMIVGSNERKFAWMDEGVNTFIDIYATAEFNHGEFAPKSDHEYNPDGGSAARNIVPLMEDSVVPGLMTFPDAMPWKYSHPVSYYKGALGLVLLREYILGHKRFDYAFRKYIHEWAYKHPTPGDFFNTMNNAGGENLNWFWKGWFMNKWTLDQAVSDVKYVDNDPAKGSIITLNNYDQLVMPVTLKITQQNGKTETVSFPVEIWEHGGTYNFRYNSTSPIKEVVVDPGEMLPDTNAKNNIWPHN
ncbi:MAG: M1 family metallopeptidase [Bacteroidales bacterium]|nr:M1 family metallopeptidase [Bacteroidales bacterium]